MVERLPRFQRRRADLITPRIDFLSAAQAEARGYQDMAAAVERMSEFAYEKAAESARAAGVERGTKEAPEVLRELMGKDPAFMSIREKAAYETATKVFGAQVEADARLQMQEVALQAERERLDPESTATRLNDVIDGFASSVNALSPATQAQLKLNLGSVRDSLYLQQSSRYLKEQDAIQTQKFDSTVADYVRTTERLGRQGVQTEVLDQNLNSLFDFMLSAGYSPEEAGRQSLLARGRFHEARLQGEFDDLETLDQRQAFIAELDRQQKSGGELVEGLDADAVTSKRNRFVSVINAEIKEMEGLAKDLASDFEDEVGDVVAKGYSPDAETLQRFNKTAEQLRAAGLDVSQFDRALAKTSRDADFNAYLNSLGEPEVRALKQELSLRVEDGATAEELEKYELVRKHANRIEEENRKDPVAWGQATGQIGRENMVAAIVGDPQGFRQVAQQRKRQARTYDESNNLKGETRYLSNDEVNRFIDGFRDGDLNTKMLIMGGIVDGFGDAAPDVFAQISEKDGAAVMAHVGGLMISGSDATTVRAAVEGMGIIERGEAPSGITNETSSKNAQRNEFFAESALAADLGVQASIIATADAIYEGQNRGRTDFDEERYRLALQLASGRTVVNGVEYGGMAEFNRRKIIVPNNFEVSGNDAVGISELLQKATADEFVMASTTKVLPQAQNNQEIGYERLQRGMVLESVGDGIYAVNLIEGGFEKSFDDGMGRAYTIDIQELKQIIDARPTSGIEPGLLEGETPTPAATQKELTAIEKAKMSAYGVPILEDNPEESRRILREERGRF